MNTLCKGTTYYEFTASRKFNGRKTVGANPVLCSATVHVARIDSSIHPFVIGSVTNGEVRQIFGSSIFNVNDLRPAYTVKSRIERIKREEKITAYVNNIRPTGGTFQVPPKPPILHPMWVSNGTFFSEHNKSPIRVLGPVIHQGVALVDIKPDNFIQKNKSDAYNKKRANDIFQRLYSSQPINFPYRAVNIERRTTANTIEDLRRSNRELLGGAGSLVSDQKVQTSGGGFNTNASYSSGPIVANSLQGRIHYLIYVNNTSYGLSWSEVASYLTKEFRDDLRGARFKEAGKDAIFYDPPIYEACVFDGGQSRQLWVRNQKKQMRIPNSKVVVPNYLCLWGIPSNSNK